MATLMDIIRRAGRATAEETARQVLSQGPHAAASAGAATTAAGLGAGAVAGIAGLAVAGAVAQGAVNYGIYRGAKALAAKAFGEPVSPGVGGGDR